MDKGFDRATAAHDAEIVVLNTCTVTEGADKDARASIRRLQRANPGCRILVTGCYAQRAPEELAALPGVTWVVGNSHKHKAAEIVTSSPEFIGHIQNSEDKSPLRTKQETGRYPGTSSSVGFVALAELSGQLVRKNEESFDQATFDQARSVFVGDIFAHTELLAAPVFEAANERTRPNLKVQDGCDNRCSFCVIPYVRGQSRSMPLERVITEVRTLVDAGYREVVISGINLGRWGRDLEVADGGTTKGQRLEFLIRAILAETSLEKLRISSVEPMDWSDDLIDLMAASDRIAKHAHVPMQSGSDAVLRRMHRKYRPWHYREKILKIRAAMPSAAIGADVMVGFAGETEAEFEETRRMIEELPFTYLHVFSYSARPGTPASGLSGQIPVRIARERNRILREIASNKRALFMKSLVETSVEAITLRSAGGEFTEALTENYLKIKISGYFQANRWMKVEVERREGEMLVGRPLYKPAIAGPDADPVAGKLR